MTVSCVTKCYRSVFLRFLDIVSYIKWTQNKRQNRTRLGKRNDELKQESLRHADGAVRYKTCNINKNKKCFCVFRPIGRRRGRTTVPSR